MSNVIYYTHASSKVCALYHDKELTKKCIVDYYFMLLKAHKKLDGFNSLVGKFYTDNLDTSDSASLYWVTSSSYHYTWLWECCLYLCLQYEKHVEATEYSAPLVMLESLPYNIVKRGFKPPYPLNPTTKNPTIESNVAVLNEVYKSVYVKPPEWPWLPGKPDWYKGNDND